MGAEVTARRGAGNHPRRELDRVRASDTTSGLVPRARSRRVIDPAIVLHTPLRSIVAALAIAATACSSPPKVVASPARDHYLFAYFKGNGEDGMHLAHSDDGFTWRALKGDSAFFK